MKKAEYAVMIFRSGFTITVRNCDKGYEPAQWFLKDGIIFVKSAVLGRTPIPHPTIQNTMDLYKTFQELEEEGSTFEF